MQIERSQRNICNCIWYEICIYRWKMILSSLLVFAIRGEGHTPRKKVCIIGSGPSGLIATKYIADYPDEFEPVTFEKQSDVGGMWIYTDSTTVDKHGLPVHSSLYKHLRC